MDFKTLSQCDGYRSLKAAVLLDIAERNIRDVYLAHAMHQIKFDPINGKDEYSKHFKWIIDRVRHYEYKTGIPAHVILDAWEHNRGYRYMNYYQNSNQPKIKNDNLIFVESAEDFASRYAEHGFIYPRCGGISRDPRMCDSGKPMDAKGTICNWKAYGLFGTLDKGVTIFVKNTCQIVNIFRPVVLQSTGKP